MHVASPHLRNRVLYPARATFPSVRSMRSIHPMSENLAADHAKLVQDYCELADRVRMIRRAVQKAFQAGVLSKIEPVGITPLQECEAIPPPIYQPAVNRKSDARPPHISALR